MRNWFSIPLLTLVVVLGALRSVHAETIWSGLDFFASREAVGHLTAALDLARREAELAAQQKRNESTAPSDGTEESPPVGEQGPPMQDGLTREGHLRSAEVILTRIVIRQPRSCAARFNFALLLQLKGDLEKSSDEYSVAASLCKERADVMFSVAANKALVRTALKDIPGALQSYQEALKIQPKSVEVKTNIELLWQDGGGGGSGGEEQKESNNDQNPPSGSQPPIGGRPQNRVDPNDVRRIMKELKDQEQRVRAKMQGDKSRDNPRGKDW